MKPLTLILSLIASATIICTAQPAVNDKDTVLPGRRLSEHQVADIATRELPPTPEFQCQFQNGVWNILEVEKNVWGVASSTTNADGKISITSTNATRIVLRVNDADGRVEHVKTPGSP